MKKDNEVLPPTQQAIIPERHGVMEQVLKQFLREWNGLVPEDMECERNE